MADKTNKVIAIIFVLIIFLFGATTVLKCRTVLIDAVKGMDVFTQSEEIDTYVSENFKSRDNWININGLFQKLMGATIIRDPGGTDVYKLENGQLMYNNEKQDMSMYADKLKHLYDYTQTQGVDFMYVQLPFKIESSEVMPPGSVTYAKRNSDDLTGALEAKGVPYMDIRENMKEESYSYTEMFFKTDHHWKPEAGLWAAGLISKRMAEEYGYPYDSNLYDIANYNIKTYEDWFLGSLGKRTGMWYSGTDDFDVITPKFETNFKFYAVSSGGLIERNGSFEESLMDMAKINEKNYFGLNTYAGYTGGDFKINTVENLNATNDTDILLLRDSFSCVLLPYLSMGAKTVTTIDMRHYEEMSVVEYIEKNDIDIVLVAYNPSSFTEGQFAFFDH